MKQLASSNGNGGKRYIVVGGDDELVTGLVEYYSGQGLKVGRISLPKQVSIDECDIIISQVFWDDEMVYISPVDGDNIQPNIIIHKANQTREQIMDKIHGFLEGIGF